MNSTFLAMVETSGAQCGEISADQHDSLDWRKAATFRDCLLRRLGRRVIVT
jgi:hypothetical protein